MKCYLLAAILFFSSLCITPTNARVQEPVDQEIIAKIRDEGLKRSQVEETFAHFTEVIGPRLTGSPAHKQAAEWARDWGRANEGCV